MKFLTERALGNVELRLRFLREARLAAALNHPAICTIHEVREVQPGEEFVVPGGAWLDRIVPPALQGDPVVSPSGKKLAYLVAESSDEARIWVQDLARGVRTAISELRKQSARRKARTCARSIARRTASCCSSPR